MKIYELTKSMLRKQEYRKRELQEARAAFVQWGLQRCSEAQVYFVVEPGYYNDTIAAKDFTLRDYTPAEIQTILFRSHVVAENWAKRHNSVDRLKKSEAVIERAIAKVLYTRNLTVSLYEQHLEGSFRSQRAKLLNQAFSKGLDSDSIYPAIAGASTPKELEYFTKAVAKAGQREISGSIGRGSGTSSIGSGIG